MPDWRFFLAPKWHQNWPIGNRTNSWKSPAPSLTAEKNARSTAAAGISVTPCRKSARSGLWIVGSGTWQHLFEKHGDGRRIGFNTDRNQVLCAADADAAIVDRIRGAGHIPRELLARFSTELLVLTYPTPAELTVLLESLGINALAPGRGHDGLGGRPRPGRRRHADPRKCGHPAVAAPAGPPRPCWRPSRHRNLSAQRGIV